MAQEKEYFAFISYQRKDEEWADRLRNKLEHYRLPSSVRKHDASLPKEIRPIFRDALELSGGFLSKEIETALQQSKFLIVICSPNSAKSPWVNKEIQTFIDLGREDCIIPFIIDGIPFSEDPDTECFPPALRSLKGEKELLGISHNEIDRNGDAASVKVVARMFGLKFDTLWKRYEREQRKKRYMIIAASLLFALVSLGVAGWMINKDWEMMKIQSRAVAEQANILTDQGDSNTARMILLEVLPKDWSWKYWPNKPCTAEAEAAMRNACQSCQLIKSHNNSGIASVAFLPQSQNFALLSWDGIMEIWDVKTGRLLKDSRTSIGMVWRNRFAAFDRDVKRIVSYNYYSLNISDATNGNHINSLKSNNKHDFRMAFFSPDGRHVVSTSDYDNTIQIWNINTKECIRTFDEHEGGVVSIDISYNGKRVVSGSNDLTIRIWDMEKSMCIDTLTEHNDWIKSVKFSPDGNRIVSASRDSTIRIWDANTGKCLRVIKDYDDVADFAAFSPDGKHIVSVSKWRIKIWDALNGECLYSMNNLYKIETATYSPDGQYVVLTGSACDVQILDIKAIPYRTLAHQKDLMAIEPSLDGQSVFSISGQVDCTLKTWDVKTGRCRDSLAIDYSRFRPITFGPNGQCIISEEIAIWDIATPESPYTITYQHALTNSVAFSPDRKIAAFAYNDTMIIRWDISKDKPIDQPLKEHTNKINLIAFSPDGQRLVSASKDSTIKIWDFKTGKCLYSKEHKGYVNTAIFSPNGRYIASASDDKTVKIWGAKTMDGLYTMEHNSPVRSIDFSYDSKHLISREKDLDVNIWDVKTGICLLKILPFWWGGETVCSVSFSPDNKHFVTATFDGTIRIWDFPPLQQLINETRERFKDRKLTPEERRKYYLE